MYVNVRLQRNLELPEEEFFSFSYFLVISFATGCSFRKGIGHAKKKQWSLIDGCQAVVS